MAAHYGFLGVYLRYCHIFVFVGQSLGKCYEVDAVMGEDLVKGMEEAVAVEEMVVVEVVADMVVVEEVVVADMVAEVVEVFLVVPL